MFNLPLDRAYAFDRRATLSNSTALLLANERAVESSVTLPLATACSRLFSTAATQSQYLAREAASSIRKREAVYISSSLHMLQHQVAEDEASRVSSVVEGALLEGCADVEFGLVALVLLGESSSSRLIWIIAG